MNGILNLPDFSLGTASVGWRIHDDGIIVIAAADFTFYKFDAIVYDPADRCVFQTGRDCIFFCPAYHAFRSIHMCDRSTSSRCCKGCAAGVGEQIQYFDRTSGISDFLSEPVPVCCLFRKQTCVFKTKRFQVKSKIFIID